MPSSELRISSTEKNQNQNKNKNTHSKDRRASSRKSIHELISASASSTDIMASLSDIEEAIAESKFDETTRSVDPISSSFRTSFTNETDARSRASRTSKSTGMRMKMDIDPAVLEQMLTDVQTGDDPSVDTNDPENKKKTRFFGSCCDLVLACVICDIVYIVKSINIIITIIFGWSAINPNDMDDDVMMSLDDDIMRVSEKEDMIERLTIRFWVLLSKNFVAIAFATIGIAGAIKHYKPMLLVVCGWCCIDLLISGVFKRGIAMGYAAFFFYPHISLFLALKKKRITHENYEEDVKYCCWGNCWGKNTEDEDGTATESTARKSRYCWGKPRDEPAAEAARAA